MKEEESIFHLSTSCPFSKEVWSKATNRLSLTGTRSGISILDCHKNWRTLNTSYPTLPAFIVWFLWRERNGAIFENGKPSTQRVVILSLLAINDYKLSHRKKKV